MEMPVWKGSALESTSGPGPLPEWLQRRDQERQQQRERRKQEKRDQAVTEEQSDFFQRSFQEERAAIEQLLVPPEDGPPALDEAALRLQRLQKFLSDSVRFLPSYDVRQAQEALQKLQGALSEGRDQLQPKKKFAFKSRKKEAAAPAAPLLDSPGLAAAELTPDPPTAFPPGVSGLSGLERQSLVKGAGEVERKDVLLSELRNCTVKLRGSPSTLHIRGVHDSRVLCGPVATSVFVDRCSGCVFAFPCQQLRTHNTRDTKVYLHVTSRAIIEDCSGIQFAPFTWSYEGMDRDFEISGLDRNKNNWSDVDDFNWLARDVKSPHWSILPVKDRITHWD
ncbi:tubulin-specific chaperone C [Rhinatrema bivittatum]|uniref:tubulin-specific chaperone C n=1 Tax=Rhinatrema bivittatum TaxID=194408 RepID=UPI00112A40B6|nr:tubulin-specific chaperone C [Rhinatrema bivittatum]